MINKKMYNEHVKSKVKVHKEILTILGNIWAFNVLIVKNIWRNYLL